MLFRRDYGPKLPLLFNEPIGPAERYGLISTLWAKNGRLKSSGSTPDRELRPDILDPDASGCRIIYIEYIYS